MSIKVLSTDEMAFIKNLPNKELEDKIILIGNEIVNLYSTQSCYLEELKQREICDYCLYAITPLMTGVYSIAEVIDDSNKRPDKTLFCVLEEDAGLQFDKNQRKSLERTGLMVQKNGGKYFKSLEEVAHYLNKDKEKI